MDIDDVDDPRSEPLNKTDTTADIKEFYIPFLPALGTKEALGTKMASGTKMA